MPSATPDATVGIERLKELIVCPACRKDLQVETGAIRCTSCGAEYRVHDGIPLLAVKGSAGTWGSSDGGETSQEYQENYEQLVRAEQYNEKYRRKCLKRMSTKREHSLLRRLLSSQPRVETLLDIPSGGGRLSAQMAPATELLFEADIAVGQVLYARESARLDVPQAWLTASAFHIPFRDGGVDATVSVRLSHHLPTPEERERLVRELLRVSRKFVIMTFFDHNSVKNLLRRARRRLGLDRKRPKSTMAVSRVAELAREQGAELVACPHLAWIGSGHRYALMVKRAGS
jgi:LSD1 subclass zinc finger protein